MAEIELESFPFDSMKVLNSETNQMEDDRLYAAEIFRKYFAKFLSNGVYYGHYKNYGENSMKVTIDTVNSGMNIKVLKGAGVIEGADFENTENRVFTLDRPATGSRVDRVVVQFNTSLDTRKTKLYIKQGNGTTPATLQRDENVYEICLAEVTAKATTNIAAADIVDTRINKEVCGIVNSLISVDGEELYQRFQNYIDAATNSLVRKDQATVVFEGTITDKNGGTSKNNFTDEYKQKLDGIDAGANKTVINNTLTSTSTKEALSANMGRKLDTEKQKNIDYGVEAPTRWRRWRHLHSNFLGGRIWLQE